MKKTVIIVVAVSILMVAGFAGFLYMMNKNSEKIRDEQTRAGAEESGIVSLQEEHFALNIPGTEEVKELVVAGEQANVLLFGNAGAADIYNADHTAQIKSQLERMQSKKEYTFKEPLLSYNPYGTNACGLYIYFETEGKSYLNYTVSAPDENIPDYTRTMKENAVNGKNAYEYLITGLIPGMENYVRLRLLSDDGREVETVIYKINMPASPYGSPSSVACSYPGDPKAVSNGLYYMYGCGSASIPAYDNAGYLREEIPLIEENAIGLVIGEAGMYVAPSTGCVAKLSVTGEVLSVVNTTGHNITSCMDYNGMGQIVCVSGRQDRKTTGDVIISVDMETGQVNEVTDFRKLLRRYYKLYAKADKKSDWLGINSLVFFDKQDVIVSAGGISSIIKIDNVTSKNPVVNYVIGDRKSWESAGMADKCLTKTDEKEESETTDGKDETEAAADGGEGDAGKIDNILEKMDAGDEPFGNPKNQTGAIPYMNTENENAVDESGSFVPVTSYYLSTISGNDGASSEYLRYKIDEESRTCALTRQQAVSPVSGRGSLCQSGVNYVVSDGSSGVYETDVNGNICITLGINVANCDKYSMKDFRFR
ncbi:MAG: aryl-sulfate sulfotransferase [Lachnospiraceae bacterium]|nr:aryl-sulfate sulfotransferase [Lachnospiraceae bacterium]